MSPDKKRVTSFDQQKKTFQYIEDNWQENEITTKMRAERQQEMETLLNRFKKPKQRPANETRHQPISNDGYTEFCLKINK